MHLSQLEKKLLSVARAEPVNEQVPYAFAKRIMARLAPAKPVDLWAIWSQSLWKAALACLVLSILVSIWSVSSTRKTRPVTLETAVLSMAEQLSDTW
jgi:hypothetical protein